MRLTLLPETFAVCRLDPHSPIPAWALATEGLVSITRTGDELSVVCPEAGVPDGVAASAGWGCLRVAGPLDFSLIGVLASFAGPLAAAGISLFALSTYDTDYLLVRQTELPAAIEALVAAGHVIEG